ncbi:HK97 gp10 family phage protein [Staphylococcus haemolyticus]|uniref:HK97 gp10 family phage protein n=1 Tax=Staphylococcus haemolyticus TaxID=1283 RepID=UPI002DBD91B4|nr:HK97 gp10 family phage protein [Staphylococcus haemolyticus]MEB5827116.1 HK97 gp10 family phage protein [Staphylococcus haemolyticus]
MARRNIDIDTKQVKALQLDMGGRQKLLATNVKRAANEVLLNAESDAKSLSPRDKGRLENSINASKATYTDGYVSGVVGSNLVYALRRHEEQERKGTYHKYENGVKYADYYINGRGEVTRAKPEVSGYVPGRKYLSNACEINKDNWRNNIGDAIADTYRGLGK